MNTEKKYRPRKIEEFVFGDPYVEQQIKRYTDGKTTRPLILYGPNGTGKTLLADIIPMELDGPNVKVDRILSGSLTSSEIVRKTFSRSSFYDQNFVVEGQSRSYIICNEAHIDSRAKRTLRESLDTMGENDLAIFTTNELAKLDPGLLSRAEKVEVLPVTPNLFLPWAQKILIAEGIEIQDDPLLKLLNAVYEAERDNRAYYKTLDQIIEQYSDAMLQ
jgi:replication-associated recombination protein RarA